MYFLPFSTHTHLSYFLCFMNILVWNCHGAASKSFLRTIKDIPTPPPPPPPKSGYLGSNGTEMQWRSGQQYLQSLKPPTPPRRYNPGILGLMEPKCSGDQANSIFNRLRFDLIFGFGLKHWVQWRTMVALERTSPS